MSQTTKTQVRNDNDREELPWVRVHVDSRVSGLPVDVITGDDLRDEQHQYRIGLVYNTSDLSIEDGQLYKNTQKPSDNVVRDVTENSPSDYRLGSGGSSRGHLSFDSHGAVMTKESEANIYEEVDSFEDEKVILWYNGLGAQFLARAIDFNGSPYASYDADGYLRKGLLQFPDGWRNMSSQDRRASPLNPRFARQVLLREDVDSLTIEFRQPENGRYNECNVFDSADVSDFDFSDEEASRREYTLDMTYTPDDEADARVSQAGVSMNLVHTDGWQQRPSNAQEEVDMGIDALVSGDEPKQDTGGLTNVQQQFVTQVVNALQGSDLDPDDVFEGGLSGLMDEKVGDRTDEQEAEMLERIYQGVDYLDVEDL